MTTKTKADAGGPFKEFDFVEWLRDEVNECRDKMKCDIEEINLANFRRHIRNAQKEKLLAMRSILDKAIERIEKAEREA